MKQDRYISVQLQEGDLALLLELLETERHSALMRYLNARRLGYYRADDYARQDLCEDLIDNLESRMEVLNNG